MNNEAPNRSYNVVAFPTISAAADKFSRMDIRMLMEASTYLEDELGLAVSLYEVDDLGEFMAFSRFDESSSSWCLARKGPSLVLWNSRTGVDLCSSHDARQILRQLTKEIKPEASPTPNSLTHVEGSEASKVICFEAERLRRTAGRGTSNSHAHRSVASVA